MKKAIISGQVVGKSTSFVYKEGVKTDEKKHYLQFLDKDTDNFGNTKAVLYDVKVTEKAFEDIKLDDVCEMTVKETEMNNKTYYSEFAE